MNKNHVKSVLTFCKKRKLNCSVHWENGVEGKLINDMPFDERVDFINVSGTDIPSFTASSIKEFNKKLKDRDEINWNRTQRRVKQHYDPDEPVDWEERHFNNKYEYD